MTVNNDGSNGILHTGLSFRVSMVLARENRARDLTASTITAKLLTEDGSTQIGDAILVAGTEEGASFGTGKVVVRIPATTTSKATGNVMLMIYETDSGGDVWGYSVSLRCVRGVPTGG